jgi:hypothetical protein
MSLFGKKKMHNVRRLSKIDKFINNKIKVNLISSLLRLRLNVAKFENKKRK